MPAHNNFRHQEYQHAPVDTVHFMRGTPQQDVSPDECQQRLRRVGDCFRQAGVAEVWLIHGAFVGTDALGVYRKFAGLLPAAANKLSELQKKAVDTLRKDVANYTSAYAQHFETGINADVAGESLPVRVFHWTSENHHVGRCHAAVRLLDELASREIPAGKRVLLWGHSHGGNVLALASNLLRCDDDVRAKFFRAARSFYRLPPAGPVDMPVWPRVQQMLEASEQGLAETPLDMVTFGTPIRYGWDSAGHANLLHFINHRPADGLLPDQAAFPKSFQDMVAGANGDFVQQIGIAGSSFAPTLLSWRAWLANKRLRRLLHQGLKPRSLLARMKEGVRVPNEGTTLLVDYGPPDGGFNEYQAGHAVYTRSKWLLFHAEQVARYFYGDQAAAQENSHD